MIKFFIQVLLISILRSLILSQHFINEFDALEYTDMIHVAVLVGAYRTRKIQSYANSITNLFKQINSSTTSNISFHIVTNLQPFWFELVTNCGLNVSVHTTMYDDLATSFLQNTPVSNYARPSAYWFFHKPLLHKFIVNIDKIILLDIDVFFLKDIKYLWKQFDLFSPSHIVGLAPEMTPVYVSCYNQTSPDRRGFNGGVQLLHLDRMRNEKIWNEQG